MRLVSLLFITSLGLGTCFSPATNLHLCNGKGCSKHMLYGDGGMCAYATADDDAAIDVDVPDPCSENPHGDADAVVDVPILFYPGKFNRMIPQELYSDFISKLRKHRKVYVANDSSASEMDEDFLKDIADSNGLCVVSHSTSANDVLELCKTIDEGFVETVVLIDPIEHLFFKNDFNLGNFELIDILANAEQFEDKVSEFIAANKFDLLRKALFGKKDVHEKKLNSKVMVLNSRLSKRWKVLPPIPPISKYSLDLKHIRNKEVHLIEDYGHFDILDAPWATIMYNTVARGAVSRDTGNINEYHTILVDLINNELTNKSA